MLIVKNIIISNMWTQITEIFILFLKKGSIYFHPMLGAHSLRHHAMLKITAWYEVFVYCLHSDSMAVASTCCVHKGHQCSEFKTI